MGTPQTHMDLVLELIDHIKKAKRDSLEQVQREIDEFKREQEFKRSEHSDLPISTNSPVIPRSSEVFACSGIDETGYGEELVCTCGYEGPDSFGNYDLIESRDCPIHGVAG